MNKVIWLSITPSPSRIPEKKIDQSVEPIEPIEPVEPLNQLKNYKKRCIIIHNGHNIDKHTPTTYTNADWMRNVVTSANAVVSKFHSSECIYGSLWCHCYCNQYILFQFQKMERRRFEQKTTNAASNSISFINNINNDCNGSCWYCGDP